MHMLHCPEIVNFFGVGTELKSGSSSQVRGNGEQNGENCVWIFLNALVIIIIIQSFSVTHG